MSNLVEQIKEQNAKVLAALTGIGTDVTDLKNKIAELVNSNVNGATQAQLEDLLADATSIAEKAAALDAENPVVEIPADDVPVDETPENTENTL